LAIYRRRKMNS